MKGFNETAAEQITAFNTAMKTLLQTKPAKPSTGEPLYFKPLHTPLGPMLAMAERRGLVMLEFLDRPILMREIEELRSRYGYLIGAGEHPHLLQIEDELKRYFDRSLTRFEVPLHTPGSIFQNQVWEALRQVPYGTTCTYGEIALLLGKPGGSRAVGLANGSNRMSIVLPCHRVIGADGSLTGYGGGKPRKEFLLRLERITLPIAEQGQLLL
ncbi:transcriptional regulator Ada / DNA-O6-methylguanine--protein-cysteine S-methyltransferase [Paucimonas lemoignei]|nr:transcriptional regulator Ada / DNA-O6-methylguanine--protein-cysteine S-methyltransferase [Paucimonas lemoignei]